MDFLRTSLSTSLLSQQLHMHTQMQMQGGDFTSSTSYVFDGSATKLLQTTTESIGLSSLCYSSDGWRITLDDGSLSLCFLDGIVMLVPSLLAVVCGSVSVYSLINTKPNVPDKHPWVTHLKIPLAFLYLVITFTIASIEYRHNGFDLRTSSPLINGFTAAIVAAIHVLEPSRLSVSSDVTLTYWPTVLCVTCMKLYQLSTRLDQSDSMSPVIISWYTFAAVVAFSIFLLEYYVPKWLPGNIQLNAQIGADEEEEEYDKALMNNSDFYSRLSISWFNPFILQACKESLDFEKLPKVDDACDSELSFHKFERFWKSRRSDTSKALLITIGKAFGWPILLSILFEALFHILNLSQPLLTREIIRFANSYWYSDNPVPFVYGIYLSIAGFFITYMKSVILTTVYIYLIRAIVSVRGSINSMIYHKASRLSPQAQKDRSMGEMVNLMAVDTETVVELIWSIGDLLQAPLQFFLGLMSLSVLFGASVLVTIPTLLVTFPAYYILARKTKACRKVQMKFNDERTKITNEILLNIKSLKLYGWERALLQRLEEARNIKQLGNLRKLMWLNSLSSAVWALIPAAISFATFAVFLHFNDTPLTADIIFPAVSLFRMITFSLNSFPILVTKFIESGVSFGRLVSFFCDEERVDSVIRLPPASKNDEDTVMIDDVTFSWNKPQQQGEFPESESLALKNITLNAKKADLICIIGRVGSGKSAFLKGILGELYKTKGDITIRGSIAYVSQEPWLLNATVRENILFGHTYDPEFYQQTILACALTADIDMLPDGDDTEIGERGVSLSGGQKARVSLARAVYARADVYLMDDPLSAVDEHVGSHLIKAVLGKTGVLATKTKILATNSIKVLSKSDDILLIENKSIKEHGTFNEVVSSRNGIYELIEEFGHQGDLSSPVDTVAGNLTESTTASSSTSITGFDNTNKDNSPSGSSVVDFALTRRSSNGSLKRASLEVLKKRSRGGSSKKSSNTQKTTKTTEGSRRGRVKYHVYYNYMKACGYVPAISTIVLMFMIASVGFITQIWLKAWSDSNTKHMENVDTVYWLGGYGFWRLAQCVLRFASTAVAQIYAGLNASQKLHDKMAYAIVRSPMSFFDTTPVGRIINRFSGDVTSVDSNLIPTFVSTLESFNSLIFSAVAILYAAPWVALLLASISVIYYYYQVYYQEASREIRRLLSTSKSPIYSHFQESLTGIVTIKAFDQLPRFTNLHYYNVDNNLRAFFLFRCCGRWISYRYQTLAAIVVFATCISASVTSSKLITSPGMVGVLLFYATSATDMIATIIRTIVQLETSFVAVERMLEYCNLPVEKEEYIEGHRPPISWPQDGAVKIENYSTRYRENLDLVLKNINININPKEKVGVVGRTGAGKSSLILSLFRLIEPVQGSIIIDSIDVSSIGLLDLRPKLSVIPQDSQVFQGTIRQNLDPVGQYTDQQLWRALELAHLKDHIESMDGGLYAELSEGGSNLSAGQRQLMCLGRALLHESSILVLDEATASVDAETDMLVQQTIRTEFKNRTIITIAHRLKTIIDSDKIVVLDKGQVVECDSPENLLKNKDGYFYGLCLEAGIVSN